MNVNLRLGYGGLRRLHRIEAGRQSFDVRHREYCLNALGECCNRESSGGSLAGCKGADHGRQTGRIHIGDIGQVDDDSLAGFLTDQMLEVESVPIVKAPEILKIFAPVALSKVSISKCGWIVTETQP
jgi:hypothetical protein